MSFGSKLTALREKAQLSQATLAERAGISIDSIQNWEQGRTRPRLEALGKLARALGVGVDALIPTDNGAGGESTKRPRGRPRKDPPEPPPAEAPPARKRKAPA